MKFLTIVVISFLLLLVYLPSMGVMDHCNGKVYFGIKTIFLKPIPTPNISPLRESHFSDALQKRIA